MDKTKQTISNILGRSGKHDTHVEETVNPAIQRETIKPHQHEEQTVATDREVHQDHYHTTVQPIAHQEVLPEKHVHNQLPTQEKVFEHGDHSKVKAGVERELGQFANTTTTAATTQSSSQGAAQVGEHIHHHVHETVQPVINKETIQPEVVHTVKPVHEVHHAPAEHHGLSTLPVKTLDEFKRAGGSVAGGATRTEEYEGHIRPYNAELQQSRGPADLEPRSHDGLHDSSLGTRTAAAGTGAGLGSAVGSGVGGTHTGSGLTGSHHTGTGAGVGTAVGSDVGGTHTGSSLTGSHHTGTGAGIGAGGVAAGGAAAVGATKLGRKGSDSSLSSSDEEKRAKRAANGGKKESIGEKIKNTLSR